MTAQTGYYVTVIRDHKVGWLFGPIAEHALAIQFVEPIRTLACKLDPWCDFDFFGTAHITTEKELPKGKLNDWFGK